MFGLLPLHVHEWDEGEPAAAHRAQGGELARPRETYRDCVHVMHKLRLSCGGVRGGGGRQSFAMPPGRRVL